MSTSPPTSSQASDASSGVADIELGAPLPALTDLGPLGARCLLRLGGRPIGTIDLRGPGTVTAAELASAIWAEAGDAIEAALAAAGQASPSSPLTASGLALPPADAPAEHEPDLTVVIATHDRPETLGPCLDSLLACRPRPASVVVVDNAPSDRRAEVLLEERGFDGGLVRYVVEPRPGLAKAHNAGLPLVDTPFVAFTDDDVTVDPGWVGALADALRSGDDVACATGLIAPAELRTPEQWWVERSTGFAKGYERRVRSLAAAASEGPLFPYDAGTLGSGANMAFRMSFLSEIGGFDPALGTGTLARGGDDLAALHLAVATGHELVYEPAAIVFHRHHADLPALERQARGYGAGLTAYLASVVAHRPAAALDIARRALPGVGRVFGRRSELNERRASDQPPHLARAERRAMLVGPVLYARQRWADHRIGRAQ